MNTRCTSSKDEKERAVASMACEAYSRDTQIEFILGKKRLPPGHDFNANRKDGGASLAIEVTGFHASGNAPGIFSSKRHGFLRSLVTDIESGLREDIKGSFWVDLGIDAIPQMEQRDRTAKVDELQKAIRNAAKNIVVGQKVSLGLTLGVRDATIEKLSEDDVHFGWSLAEENVNSLNIQNDSAAEFCAGTLQDKNRQLV